MKTIEVAVVGASGFAGVELVRLLMNNPRFTVGAITSDSMAGTRLDEAYPAFTGLSDLVFQSNDDVDLGAYRIVFLAVPHTAALSFAPGLLAQGVTVIDLSADYRLKDPAVYERWYGTPHTSPELLEQAVCGLPELYRTELYEASDEFLAGGAVLVACPGCYPTATALAAFPAVLNGVVDERSIIVDAISGVTGAGKKPTDRTHFCFANENVEPYGVGTHRHTPEIAQLLGVESVVFTPHLAPLNRGLLSTVTMRFADEFQGGLEGLRFHYEFMYMNKPMVNLLPDGQWPKTSSVAGTGYASVGLGISADHQWAIAACAIDNLGKGAAAQAMQCANILCDAEEDCGMSGAALPI